jgi:cysteine sulfinate desulfinase/cysteine desulfurase-like protein
MQMQMSTVTVTRGSSQQQVRSPTTQMLAAWMGMVAVRRQMQPEQTWQRQQHQNSKERLQQVLLQQRPVHIQIGVSQLLQPVLLVRGSSQRGSSTCC